MLYRQIKVRSGIWSSWRQKKDEVITKYCILLHCPVMSIWICSRKIFNWNFMCFGPVCWIYVLTLVLLESCVDVVLRQLALVQKYVGNYGKLQFLVHWKDEQNGKTDICNCNAIISCLKLQFHNIVMYTGDQFAINMSDEWTMMIIITVQL